MPKRRRLNRDSVIAKAAAIADDTGSPDAVSLTALAQALHIRTPSLYNHISNLKDLRHGLTLYGVKLLLEELRQASMGLVGRPALEAVADGYRRFAQAHPGLYPLTVSAPDADDEALTALAQELLQLLLLLLASIGLQGDDAVHAIRGFRAILHGFVTLEVAGGYEMPLDREESFRRLVATFLDGLV